MRRAIYKQNGLSGTSPSGYKYVGFDVDTFSEITGTTVSAIGGSSKNYIEYVGLLSQSGTNAPTLITLVNELGSSPTPSYLGPGFYRISFGDNTILTDYYQFGQEKAFSQIETNATGGIWTNGAINSAGITLISKDYTGSFSNIGNDKAAFIVRVYNGI